MLASQPGRHLLGNRRREVGLPEAIFGEDAFEQFDSFRPVRPRKAREGFTRGGDRRVNVSRGAEADPPSDLFGRRIDHVAAVGSGGVDPASIDVEFQIFAHRLLPPRI